MAYASEVGGTVHLAAMTLLGRRGDAAATNAEAERVGSVVGVIDAETQAFLAGAGRRGSASPRDAPIGELRAATEELAARFGMEAEVVGEVRGVDGARVYEPAGGESRGVVVYAHGGAFVRGSLDSHDGLVRALTSGSRCVVVSVDYRLAPEHPFPAALEDFHAAVQWASSEFAGAPLAVAGDSAGGNLAAACALKTRDEGGAPIAVQALIQAVLDMRAEQPSIDLLGEEYLLPRDYIEWSRDLYAGHVDFDEPLVSPLRARDHRELPPALIVTGELDPFRDEGEAYAAALNAAGVPAEHVRYAGLIHHAVLVPRLIGLGARVIHETARRIGAALEVTHT